MQVLYVVCIASYELMLKCWALDPEERPTPVDLVATLTPLDGPPAPEEMSEVKERLVKDFLEKAWIVLASRQKSLIWWVNFCEH